MTTLDILAPEIFDCNKTYRSSCEAIGCEGGHNLTECSIVQSFEQKRARKMALLQNQNRKICGFCEECETCTRIQHIRMCLDDAYYFKPRKDGPF